MRFYVMCIGTGIDVGKEFRDENKMSFSAPPPPLRRFQLKNRTVCRSIKRHINKHRFDDFFYVIRRRVSVGLLSVRAFNE